MSLYIVLADFHAEEEEELSLQAGTAVEVLHFGDDGWADVVYQGTAGICPNAYLKLATDVEIPEPVSEEEEENFLTEEEKTVPPPKTPQTIVTRVGCPNRNTGRPLPTPGENPTPAPAPAPEPTPSPVATPTVRGGRGSRVANGPLRGTARGGPRGANRGRGAPRGAPRGGPRGRATRARGAANPRGGARAPVEVSTHEELSNKPPPTVTSNVGSVQAVPEETPASPPAETEEALIETNAEASPPEDESVGDSAKKEAQRKHRKMVLAEILQTERDYVNDIEIVARVYIRPLLEKNIITREDHTALFSNLEVLVHVNQQLLAQLQSEEDLELLRIGVLFLEMAEYFKTYASYCANQPKFITTLNRLTEENSAFDQYLYEQTQTEECRGLDLFSFLIKPIQRICKYPLLLRDLLKVTEEDHFDQANLVKSLVKIEEVVSYVNDRKRLAENLQKILDVQDQIESNVELSLVEPSRRFVREGSLNVVENGRVRERNTFVFNDLIVLTKPKKSMMGYAAKDHFKAKFYLNDIKIVDVADTDDVKNACQVLPKNEEKKFDFVFMFDTPTEKSEWVKEIKTLVREFQLKELRAAQEAKAKREEEEANKTPTWTKFSAGASSSAPSPQPNESQQSRSSPMPRRAAPERGARGAPRGSFQRPAPAGRGRTLTGRPNNNPAPASPSSGAKGMLKSFFR